MNKEQIDKKIFDQFGLNSGYVSELYEKYLENNEVVSDYWRNYFETITKNGNVISPKIVSQKSTVSSAVKKDTQDIENAELITGVGAKIIENMESSLSIPTATSLRTISVKLLEENRRIINHHLKRLSEGKISFSHMGLWCIIV